MFKSVLTLYIVIFGLYILFTRQPDFFDGEKTPATVHFLVDSSSKELQAFASFSLLKKQYKIPIQQTFTRFTENETVQLIYETEHPQKAKLYTFYGYWITWQEIIASIVLCFVLFQIAVGITNNPSPESLQEQLNYSPEKKRKYNG